METDFSAQKPRPARPVFTSGELQLIHVEEVADATCIFRWKVLSEAFSFTPGQFISLQFGPKTWRAYSIASVPGEPLELLIRLIPGGKGSEALRHLNVGETVPFRGAFGHFVVKENVDGPLVFCGTGTGIAPFKSMIRAEVERATPREMHLWYGGRTPSDIAYLDELQNWAPHLQVRLGFSRTADFGPYAADATEGRITQFVAHKPDGATYYLCGNGDMVQGMKVELEAAGVPVTHILFERFN